MENDTENCIFCKIASGKDPHTTIEYENSELVIFRDIKPVAEYHYLAVPKKHLESAKNLKAEDEVMVINMESALKSFLQSKDVDTGDAIFGFHWPPFISVHHIHMHGIAPASKMGFKGRWIFKPGTMWFSSSEYVRQRIK